MVYEARENFDIPNVDVLSLIFEHGRAEEHSVLFADAAEPSFQVTKAEARHLTKRIAHGLRHNFGIGAHGPSKDVVLGISCGQHLLPTAFYGVVAAGGVYSAASAAFTASELERQIKNGPAKVVIACLDVRDVAIEAAKSAGLPLDHVLILESKPEARLRSVDGTIDCLPTQELDWPRIRDPNELENSIICLLYSSGTTGPPKGVKISHLNMVAETFCPSETNHRIWKEKYGKRPWQYRTLAHLPAAHVAGVQGYFMVPPYEGGIIYWMPKFDFMKFLEYNKKYGITWFFTVPPIYLLISKAPMVTDQFRTLKQAVGGAAPMSANLQEAANKKVGGDDVFVIQTYGLSETTGMFTVMPVEQHDDTGSVGFLIANNTMRLVDDDGKDVEPGKPGEILAKGPVVTKGYHNNPKANAESFVDSWFKTGDIGEVRSNGKLYIVDRKKELIKYKGLQVAPAELEALLISNPLITDAAVIGVPGEGTELPRAYVVADRSKISEDQIKAFVKSKLASHKQLRGGVVFVPEIPKSPSGKILRKDLRVLAQKTGQSKL